MSELFAYHVVTEKPMVVGQHIIFDEMPHNGVWKRVNEKLYIVKEIYRNTVVAIPLALDDGLRP